MHSRGIWDCGVLGSGLDNWGNPTSGITFYGSLHKGRCSIRGFLAKASYIVVGWILILAAEDERKIVFGGGIGARRRGACPAWDSAFQFDIVVIIGIRRPHI